MTPSFRKQRVQKQKVQNQSSRKPSDNFRKPSDVSVIIPTLNEQDHVAAAIRSAQDAGAGETIVSDGGSTDNTLATATTAGATKFVRSLPGRGTQLASGLSVAKGDVVLFLHADNLLGKECLNQICQLDDFVWGAFKQQINSRKKIYRAIECGNATRVQWRGMAFGDQAIFANRKVLMNHGGVSEIPLMEDVDLSRRLRKLARPSLLDGPIQISSRRWEQTGILRQTIRNWTLQLRYAVGASPESLVDRY